MFRYSARDVDKTVDAIDYFGMTSDSKVNMTKKFIHDIYEELSSKASSNCRHWRNEQCLQLSYVAGGAAEGEPFSYKKFITTAPTFGCNKWDVKDA